MTSAYDRLLEVARRQAEAVDRGDLDEAVALMPLRESVLRDTSTSLLPDTNAITEILRLDHELATAIRRRMIEIRNEAVGLQHGRRALRGYQPPTGERRPRRLNALG